MGDVPEANTGQTTIKRRAILLATGGTVALSGIGAFAGTAAAWKRFDTDFKGCSEVWLVIDEADLDFEKYEDRSEPLFVNVVVETADGEAACRRVEFTEKTTTTIPGQYGKSPLVKYEAKRGEKILAVVKYNHKDNAICFIENDNRCAHTPNVADWTDADCYEDLYDVDADRFNVPCSDRGKGGESSSRGRSAGSSRGRSAGSSRGRAVGSGRGPATRPDISRR